MNLFILKLLNDQNPRQIAARVLSQRQTSSEFTENLLDIALATARLSPVDRGLCHELVCGVVRWQATLDRLIARKTDPAREPRPALKNLLRLGLYQIFWLDRIPPHAAVHETVEQAKRSGYSSQAGFINAVLRGFLRQRETLESQASADPARRFNVPAWWLRRVEAEYGQRAPGLLAAQLGRGLALQEACRLPEAVAASDDSISIRSCGPIAKWCRAGSSQTMLAAVVEGDSGILLASGVSCSAISVSIVGCFETCVWIFTSRA